MLLAAALCFIASAAPADGTATHAGTAERFANFVRAPGAPVRKPVLANPRAPCGAADVIKERLEAARWQEQVGGIGITDAQSNPRLVYLYRATSGTWTVVMEDSQGIACIIAAGSDWQVYSIDNGS